MSPDEYRSVQRLFTAEGTVDFAEFIALELMRMGKVEPSTLSLIKAEFERLDADGNGRLTISEVLTAGRSESGGATADEWRVDPQLDRRYVEEVAAPPAKATA